MATYGKITQIFTSPALLATDDGDRINVVVEFEDKTAQAVYTSESTQIPNLQTQKGYGVYFGVADNAAVKFVSGGETVTGYLHFADLIVDDTEDEVESEET